MSDDSQPLDEHAASRMAPAASLRDIACVTFRGSWLSPPPQGFSEDGMLGWDIDQPTFTWTLIDRDLHVIAPIRVPIRYRAGDDEHDLAHAEVTFRIHYVLSEDVSWDRKDIPHFVGISGLLHLWPYLRSDVQFLTTKLGLPPLTLPLIVSGVAAQIPRVEEDAEGLLGEKASPQG